MIDVKPTIEIDLVTKGIILTNVRIPFLLRLKFFWPYKYFRITIDSELETYYRFPDGELWAKKDVLITKTIPVTKKTTKFIKNFGENKK